MTVSVGKVYRVEVDNTASKQVNDVGYSLSGKFSFRGRYKVPNMFIVGIVAVTRYQICLYLISWPLQGTKYVYN